jgi:hypothetical protein
LFWRIRVYFYYSGTVISLPKNKAFKNNLLVPYHAPLKLGLSANKTALPLPIALTNNDAEGLIKLSKLFLDIKPSIRGFSVYFATVVV